MEYFIIMTVAGVLLWVTMNYLVFDLFFDYKIKMSLKGFTIRSIIAGLCIGTFITAFPPRYQHDIIIGIAVGVIMFLLKTVYGYFDELTLKKSIVNGLTLGIGFIVFMIFTNLFARLLEFLGL